jgi:protein ImuA
VPPPSRLRKRQVALERLRAELARLDGSARRGQASPLPLGLPRIDHTLPGGGLPRGCLHEICGDVRRAAAGFATALLGRLAAQGPVVWIAPENDLFAPGLIELGLRPEQLIVVRARKREARLWALEEVLRSPGPAAGLAEVDRLGLRESRRLQLAAESRGVVALLLRPKEALLTPSAAFTRWRIETAGCGRAVGIGHGLGALRWQVELARCRGGRTGSWQIAWHNGAWHEVADPLALAAEPSDRPAAPARQA